MTTPTNEELMTQLGITAQQAADLVQYFENKKNEEGNSVYLDAQNSTTDSTPDRLMRVGAIGYAATKQYQVPEIPNDESQIASGLWRDGDGSSAFGQAVSILTSRFNNTRMGQFAITHHEKVRMLFRSMISDNLWSDVFEVFHSGNLNINKFGGNGIDDWISEGWAKGTTSACFSFELMSDKTPVGITVTGSFKILSFTGNEVIASEITSQNLIFKASSSNKKGFIVVDGLTGLTSKELVILSTESQDAKIEWNY